MTGNLFRKNGEIFPGNELPGYFQKSLRDKKIPFRLTS